MIIVSYSCVLTYQIQTYHKIKQLPYIDLYALRCIKVAHHQSNPQYPLIEYYDDTEIIIDKNEDIYFAHYQNTCLKVIYQDNKIISYEYE